MELSAREEAMAQRRTEQFARLVHFLLPRISVADREVTLDMVEAYLAQAYSDGLRDAVLLCEDLARAKSLPESKRLVISTIGSALELLRQKNLSPGAC